MSWPDDGYGDVFRRMEAAGFDFSRPHTVDFNVDFESWPPSTDALEALQSRYGPLELVEPQEGDLGFVNVRLTILVTYDAIVTVTDEITREFAWCGGSCIAWGVMQE